MGKKYIVSLHEDKDDNTAGSKAKDDITEILLANGFSDLQLYLSENKLKSISANVVSLAKSLFLQRVSTVVFQYPIYSNITTKLFFAFLRSKRNTQKICFVHDVESIREQTDQARREIERKTLNEFDCLVVHNPEMRKLLENMGVTVPMVEIELFDYLTSSPMITEPRPYLTFAGNLKKAKFLNGLKLKTPVKVFGPNKQGNFPDNIEYQGSLSPEELGEHLDGRMGIIWDGDTATTGSGVYGQYMRINNPHKASLYLSMGVPVIVWSGAAIAKVVKHYGVGICLDNLLDVDAVLEDMTSSEYEKMKKNAESLGKKLRQGFFTQRALEGAVALINEQK